MMDAIPALGNAFRGVVEASLHATLLALAAGVMLWILRDRVSARWKHIAWMLVAARLCLPAGLAVPVINLSVFRQPVDVDVDVNVDVDVDVDAGQTNANDPVRSVAATDAPGPAASSAPPRQPLRPEDFLAPVWLAGSLFFAARVLLRALRDRRRLRCLRPVSDPRLLDSLAACARELGMRRPPPLLTGPEVAVPSLAGLFRPRILVPEERLGACSAEELRQVFLHELSHLVRRDVAWNWLLAMLGSLHWFNPAVRWAILRAREERELACDELVLRRSGQAGAASYASTLVRLIESSSLGQSPVATALDGSRFIERRLRWIAGSPGRRCSPVLAAVLLAGLTACGLCCVTGSGEPVVRTYDVVRLLEPAPDYPAPHLGVSRGLETQKPEDPEVVLRKEERRRNELAELIRSRVSPETWTRGGRMQFGDGLLEVTAPEPVHRAVKDFLQLRREEQGLLVTVFFKLVSLDPDAIPHLPPGVARDVEALKQGKKLPSRVLSPDELQGIEGGGLVERNPKVSVFNHGRSHSLVINQSAHIVDYQPSEVDGKKVMEPVIGILNRGVIVECRAEIGGDRKRVDLEVKYQWGDVRSPVKSILVEGLGPIAVPELSLCQAVVSLDAPLGEWLLASAFGTGIPTEATKLLLVKAEAVPPADKSGEK